MTIFKMLIITITIRQSEALLEVEVANRPQNQPPQDQDLSNDVIFSNDAFGRSHDEDYSGHDIQV